MSSRDSSQLMPRSLVVVCIYLFMLHTSEAGRIVEHITDGTIRVNLMNDYGVPVSGFNKLVFDAKACANAVFIMSETSSFTNRNSKYFMVMLGASKTKRLNGIKDSCFKCSTFHASVMTTTVSCNDFNSYFVKWDNNGSIQIGRGKDATNLNEVFLEYKSPNSFRLNYLNVMSLRNKATWRFRVDREPRFTAPVSYGGTVITVSEVTQTDKEIFQLKAWDYDDDNVTFNLGDKHRDVFKVEGQSLMLIKNLDYETQTFYSIDVLASDGGLNPVPVVMSIRVTDINDELPIVRYNTNFMLPEEMPIGYVINGLFSVKDRDTNDSMTFKLEGNDSKYFKIDEAAGTMTTNQTIDFDGRKGVKVINDLTLVVSDKAGHEVKKMLKIYIRDINDNSPSFERVVYKIHVTINSVKIVKLTNFNITDADSGKNGQFNVTLSSTGRANPDVFTIQGTTLLMDSSKIDCKHLQDQDFSYTLIVQAVDMPDTGTVHTGSAAVVVRVPPNPFSKGSSYYDCRKPIELSDDKNYQDERPVVWTLGITCGVLSLGMVGSLLAVYNLKTMRNKLNLTPEVSMSALSSRDMSASFKSA